jgi:hypothetical protein
MKGSGAMILVSCQAVTLFGPVDDPTDVTFTFSIGGGTGDGQVDVTAGPGEFPCPVSLPTGTTGVITFKHVTVLRVHYRKSATGPASILVECVAVPV